jgi:hypothetical protein
MATLKITAARKATLQKIAQSARKMATRCKRGYAKEIGQGKCFEDGKACCVFGHVLAGAFPHMEVDDTITGNDEALSRFLRTKRDDYGDHVTLPKQFVTLVEQISKANDQAANNARLQKAVVEPLREFADEVAKLAKLDVVED